MRFLRRKPRAPRDFDAASYAEAHPDIGAILGLDADALYRHWTEWGYLENRTPFGLRPYAGRRLGAGFWRRADAVTLYGPLDAPSGLGTAVRAYRAGLEAAGIDVRPVTVSARGLRFETMPPTRATVGWGRSRAPREAAGTKVNLFALNADMVHRFFLDGRLPVLDDAYSIAIWFWELAAFPPVWTTAFGAFDEIWTASDFCRLSIGAISPVPVATVPMPVDIPPLAPDAAVRREARRMLGLPEADICFACVFDVGSVVARKNPLAALEAFRAVCGDRGDAILVLKYHGSEHYPDSVTSLREAAAGLANVVLLDRTLDQVEAATFRRAIDCLVSPHRSEGFGWNVAETLALGTPVIATDYSGSTDILDAGIGDPVPYRLAAVGPDAGTYPPTALWADPDPTALAEALRRVLTHRLDAAAIGARGRARMAQKHSAAASAAAIRARLDPVFARRKSEGPPPSWGRSRGAVSVREREEGPRLAVLAPVARLGAAGLATLIEGLMAQENGAWDLIAAPDSVPDADLKQALDAWRGRDPRLKIPPPHDASRRPATLGDVLAFSVAERVVLLADGRIPGSGLADLAVARSVLLASPEIGRPYRFDEAVVAALRSGAGTGRKTE